MAYPTVSAPYGFKPINRVDGMPYAGATRQYSVDPAANIFYGDLVKIVAGVVTKITGTLGVYSDISTEGAAVGVFVGAQYTNSQGQTIQGQYYPAGSANGIAYVVVDGQAAYQVVVTTSGGSVVNDTSTIASIGANMEVNIGTGSATTGDSGSSVIAGTEGVAATLPVKVIDVVPATKTATGYPELIVKINVSQFDSADGVI